MKYVKVLDKDLRPPMARIIKEGKHVYWLDGEGLKVPVEYGSKADRGGA